MKNQFVKTSNYERFITGLSVLENRGASEASLLLVDGDAGFGKSKTVDYWAVQNGALYLRAKTQWTPSYFMSELADLLKVDSTGRTKTIFGRVAARLGGQEIPLVIDEVDHCLRNGADVLETVRDISDLTEIPVILVGMERVQTKIARHKQISSRIAKVVEFQPASLDDIALTCNQLAEVIITNDLIEEIHRQSRGLMRQVMNAIAVCENTAKLNGLKQISTIEMAGKVLTHDWQERRPRAVKAVGGR